MNRLILIGNGFDLAHGLKTSYNDFMLWYLKESFGKAFEQGIYNDELLDITKNWGATFPLGPLQNISDFIDHYYKNGFEGLLENHHLKFPSYLVSYTNVFVVKYKSKLLYNLLISLSNLNWVDVENQFYEELRYVIHSTRKDKKITLNKLNGELAQIIDFLQEYLTLLSLPVCIPGYYDIFESIVKEQDVGYIKLKDYDNGQPPRESLILNFNYTSTAEMYLKPNEHYRPLVGYSINYIHGEINELQNPLIFGFGDELDQDYLKMELEKINEYFQHIKSFWYFKTSNYYNLIRFIEFASFQVYILGIPVDYLIGRCLI